MDVSRMLRSGQNRGETGPSEPVQILSFIPPQNEEKISFWNLLSLYLKQEGRVRTERSWTRSFPYLIGNIGNIGKKWVLIINELGVIFSHLSGVSFPFVGGLVPICRGFKGFFRHFQVSVEVGIWVSFCPSWGSFWLLFRWSDMSPSTGIRGPCRTPWFGLSDNPENLRLLRDLNSWENDRNQDRRSGWFPPVGWGQTDSSGFSSTSYPQNESFLTGRTSDDKIPTFGGLYAHTYIQFLIM